MAFKNVTTGLTDLNAVINELVTFMTVDLPSPWTLEYNLRPTNANVSGFQTGDLGRNTVLSIRPAQVNVAEAFHDPVLPVQPSPLDDKIYVKLRNVTEPGVMMAMSGYSPAGWQSPESAFLDNIISDSSWFDPRPTGLGNTATVLPVAETNGSTGPFTQMWMFGPNQASPQDPVTPNYVYFVIETEPGRYTHGHFGEIKKFVPWAGGHYCAGNDRASSDQSDSQTNETMWNQDGGSGPGKVIVAGALNQVQLNLASANSYSPEPYNRWLAKNLRGQSGWAGTVSSSSYGNMAVWGHTTYRTWMTVGTGVSRISGFVPLATPIVFPLDEQASANKADRDGPIMPAGYPADFYMGDISTFEPGVEVTVGGISIVPFPITSTLGTSPRSTFGGYFYRKLV